MKLTRSMGLLLIGGAFLGGCVSTGVKKPKTQPGLPSVTTPPSLPKTFGNAALADKNALFIRYKSILIAFNPNETNPRNEPYDYVFLSGNAPLPSNLRKDQKILLPSELESSVAKQGFTQLKVLTPGQRLMLKKNDGFLFVSAVHDAGNNAYLLEFDAGRNIFLSRSLNDSPALREFVYGLRDDGKEIHLGFYLDSKNSDVAGKMIALMQPQIPVLNTGDAAELKQIFAQEMYNGDVRFIHQGETIEF